MYNQVIDILEMPTPLLLVDVKTNRVLLAKCVHATGDITLRKMALPLLKLMDLIKDQILHFSNRRFSAPAKEVEEIARLQGKLLQYCKKAQTQNMDLYVSILTLFAGETYRVNLIEFLSEMIHDATDVTLKELMEKYLRSTDLLFDLLTPNAKRLPEIRSLLERETQAKLELVSYCGMKISTQVLPLSEEEFEAAVLMA